MRRDSRPYILLIILFIFYIFMMLFDDPFVLVVLDKYESNNTGDGQTYYQTITEVCTGEIYEFVWSDVVNHGVTQRRTLMTRVSRNVRH